MGEHALRALKASLTVEGFEKEFKDHFTSLLHRVPCRTTVERRMTHLLLMNEERDEVIDHVMNYDIAPFENIHQIENRMIALEWYPCVVEETSRKVPWTASERENLIRTTGMSVEEAYTHPGKLISVQRVWTVQRIRLNKNILTIKHEDRRIVIQLKDTVSLSGFLRDLRSKVLDPRDAWTILKEQHLTWKERL